MSRKDFCLHKIEASLCTADLHATSPAVLEPSQELWSSAQWLQCIGKLDWGGIRVRGSPSLSCNAILGSKSHNSIIIRWQWIQHPELQFPILAKCWEVHGYDVNMAWNKYLPKGREQAQGWHFCFWFMVGV